MLAVLCIWTRTSPAVDIVFADPLKPQLLGTDAHFHLRHTTYAAGNRLQLLRQDCGSGFPQGPPNDAAGLWDLGLAAAARLRYGPAPGVNEVARTMAWAPPLLAALTLLLLYRACRCALSRAPSLAACSLFVLYPGESLERTLVGFADHHAAELLLATALILGLLLQTRRTEAPPGWGRSFLQAAPVVALTFTWRGAPLYLAAALLSVPALAVVAVRSRHLARGLACALWRYGAAAAISTAVVGLLVPSLILERRSLLLVIAACAGLAALSLLAAALIQGTSHRATSRFGVTLAILALGIMAALLTQPLFRLTASVLAARSSLVSEHAPISVARIVQLTGLAGLLALPGLLVAGWQSWQRRLSPSSLLLACYGALLFGLWTTTRDFGYVAAPFLAVNAALALTGLLDTLFGAALPTGSGLPAAGEGVTTRRAGAGALVFLAIIPVWPLGISQPPFATEVEVSALSIYSPAWLRAMAWFEEHSPAPARSPSSCEPSRHAGTDGAADYGVMTPWMYGDAVAVHADRFPRWSRQPSVPIAAWGLATTEAEATKRLCPECSSGQAVRYAVIGASTCGHRFLAEAAIGGPPFEAVLDGQIDLPRRSVPRFALDSAYRDSMFFRLCSDRGNGLSTYRLVYESPERALTLSRLRPSGLPDSAPDLVLDLMTTDPSRNPRLARRLLAGKPARTPLGILYDARLDAEVSVYEIVTGAILRGRAPAGAQIVASLDLGTQPGGGRWTYEVTSRAADDGTFSLRVAYPTTPEPDRSALKAERPYTLRATGPDGPLMAELEVRPEDVRDGAVLQAPRLAAPF